MSSRPSVTVLVPTYNRAQFLAECLDSLFSQTLPPVQVLVMNDGSTDETPMVLEPYRNRISYWETPQLGKPGSINAGLEKVKGDYLWIFDDDDVALPDALERFVEPLERQPEYGFSYSTYWFTQSRPGTHRIGEPMREYVMPDLQSRGPLVPLLEVNYLGGAALFARTACYQKTGPFDPHLLRSQDYEMAIRMVRNFRGVPVRGGATFHYRQHKELRGSMHDRFSVDKKVGKWLEYDQIIFRRLYRELSLEDYAPGTELASLKRVALLQRLSIMASRHLPQEALADLEALDRLSDERAFTKQEKRVIRLLMAGSWYFRMANVLDLPEIHGWIRAYAPRSFFARALRAEFFNSALMLFFCHPSRHRLINAIRAARLYV